MRNAIGTGSVAIIRLPLPQAPSISAVPCGALRARGLARSIPVHVPWSWGYWGFDKIVDLGDLAFEDVHSHTAELLGR